MAGEDDENLSYTQARRRVGLDHVRAVRKAIEDTARPEPTDRRLQPSQSLTQAAVPSPALPGAPPRPVTVRPESSVSQQITDLTTTVADLAQRVVDITGTEAKLEILDMRPGEPDQSDSFKPADLTQVKGLMPELYADGLISLEDGLARTVSEYYDKWDKTDPGI